MQFIRSSALLREARREEVVGREDRVAAMEWLRIYDEALDGRVDGGFFDFQVEASLGMTIDHPFSLQTQKTEGMHRLLSRMFLEGPPLQATPREYLVSGDRALIRGQHGPRLYPARPQRHAFHPVGHHHGAQRAAGVQHRLCLTALHQPYGAVAP